MQSLSWKSVVAITALYVVVALGLSPAAGQPEKGTQQKPPAAEVNRPAPQPSADGKGPRLDRYGDPLPEGILQRFGTIRFRHKHTWWSDADLSPDGTTLVAGDASGATLFEVATGKPRLLLADCSVPRFGSSPHLLAFAPDGKAFANGVLSDILIRDAATGKTLRRIELAASVVGYADGGKSLLAYNGNWTLGTPRESDQVVRFLEADSGRPLRAFPLNGFLFGISPDHKFLLAGGGEKKAGVVLYDALTGKNLHHFAAQRDPTLATLTPDNNTLVASDREARVLVWDVGAAKPRHDIRASVPPDSQTITSLAVTRDGKAVLAGTEQGTILRWDLASGKELSPLSGHKGEVRRLLPAPDGKTLVSFCDDGLFRRWDLTTGKAVGDDDGYIGSVRAAAAPDGKVVVVGCGAGRLDVWDTASGERLRTLRRAGPGVHALAFSPDGKTLAVGQDGNRVALWDAAPWHEIRVLAMPTELEPGVQGRFGTLTFSPDGRFLLASCVPHSACFWDINDAKLAWHNTEEWEFATFSSDGKTLVAYSETTLSTVLAFRDASTGRARLPPTEAVVQVEERFTAVAFAPDSSTLATGHVDGTVRFRDPATAQETRRFQVCDDPICGISFSPDAGWLLCSSASGGAWLHEAVTGQGVLELPRIGSPSRFPRTALGPDGKTALTTTPDLTVLYRRLRPAGVPAAKGNESALWDDLRSEKAAVAYRAQWALLDEPAAAVDLLGRRLPPSKVKADRATVLKLIAGLNAPNFQRREEATKALAALEREAEPLLRNVLAKPASAEQERRARDLLAALQRRELTADELRVVRAVQALELSGAPEARRLLREWAEGAPGALLTERAKASLSRLK